MLTKNVSNERKNMIVRFSNDFVFWKILTQNDDLCKELLELILDKRIRKIEKVESQKTLKQTTDGKSIRLDVYVEDDENTIYDIEMQTTSNNNLPKRTRYYQGIMDLNLIEQGEEYTKLKTSYIIFICLKDPFGRGLPIYTFKNKCMEQPDLELGDNTTKVFLNASGCRAGLSDKMAAFLDFLEKDVAKDDFTKRLEYKVRTIENSDKWGDDVMKYEADLMDARQQGLEQGLSNGILGTATILLSMNMKTNEICSAIIRQYNISKEEAEEFVNKAKKNK